MIKVLFYILIGILGVLAAPFILTFLLVALAYGVGIVAAIVGTILVVVGGLLPLLLTMAAIGLFVVVIVKLSDWKDK
jgi:hypothetical protein